MLKKVYPRETYNKKYYDNNKAKILKHLNTETECVECKTTMKLHYKSNHNQSAKHKRNVELAKEALLL